LFIGSFKRPTKIVLLNSLESFKISVLGGIKLLIKEVDNGKEATVNRAVDGSTYPS
jgi:hypothetical protein